MFDRRYSVRRDYNPPKANRMRQPSTDERTNWGTKRLEKKFEGQNGVLVNRKLLPKKLNLLFLFY